MVASVVLDLTNLKPGCLSTTHGLEALVQVGMVPFLVDDEHVSDSTSLVEVDQLTIVEPSLMLIVDCVAGLGHRTTPLDSGQDLEAAILGHGLSLDWRYASEIEKLILRFAQLRWDPIRVMYHLGWAGGCIGLWPFLSVVLRLRIFSSDFSWRDGIYLGFSGLRLRLTH